MNSTPTATPLRNRMAPCQRLGSLIGAAFLVVLGQLISTALIGTGFGPSLGGDSGRYVGGGERFPNLINEQWGYTGYIALSWLGHQIGSAEWFLVGVQYVAAALAGFSLYWLASRVAGPLAGWVAASLYLLNPAVAQWTTYILPDSLFWSGTIVAAACVVRWLHNEAPQWAVGELAVLIAVVVGVASLRPNGVVLLGSLVTAVLLRMSVGLLRRVLFVALCWVAIAGIALGLPVLSSGGGGDQNSFASRAFTGEVIWGSDSYRLTMPTPNSDGVANVDLLRYAIDHPVAVAKLSAARVGVELGLVRPYFSAQMNALRMLTVLVTYPLAVLGWLRARHQPLGTVASAVTLASLGLVAVTWADIDARFVWWFAGIWMCLAGIGFATIFKKIASRRRHTRAGAYVGR